MKIIDFHTHIFPDALAVRGSQSISDFYGLPNHQSGSAARLLQVGARAGISEFVLLPVAVKAEHVQSINDFTAEAVKTHREFHGFGTVHAEMPDLVAEVERMRGLSLKGVKLHPDMQRFPIDDKRLYPMYDAVQGRMPVLIHCGDPRYDFSDPARLRRVLDAFPNLCVIAAHLGGWSMFDRAFAYLKDTRCLFDLSSCIPFIGADAVCRYIKRYGAERVLFGSDFPQGDPPKEVERFFALDLTDAEREQIAHKNAERILG